MFIQNHSTDQESEVSFELLIQIWMRFIIAFSSLLVFLVDPFQSRFPPEIAHMMLISYCLYSACFVFVHDMQQFRKLGASRLVHWIDTIYYAFLVVLTGGVDSIFFFFFFFPIIVSSFAWGLSEGIKVTLASAGLFTLAGLVSITTSVHYEIQRSDNAPDLSDRFRIRDRLLGWGQDHIQAQAGAIAGNQLELEPAFRDQPCDLSHPWQIG